MPDATFTCPDLTTFCRLDGLTLLSARPLADVAAICGYADQAHLNREFRDLADCTPGTGLDIRPRRRRRHHRSLMDDRRRRQRAGAAEQQTQHLP